MFSNRDCVMGEYFSCIHFLISELKIYFHQMVMYISFLFLSRDSSVVFFSSRLCYFNVFFFWLVNVKSRLCLMDKK